MHKGCWPRPPRREVKAEVAPPLAVQAEVGHRDETVKKLEDLTINWCVF